MLQAHPGVAQLFSGEFGLARVVLGGEDGGEYVILTPTGLVLREVVIAGVLLEKSCRGERLTGARVADATGAFELHLSDRDLSVREELEAIAPPAFVALSGRVRLFRAGGGFRGVVFPSRICTTSREARDSWTLRTAELTLSRIEAMILAMERGCGAPETMEAIRRYNPSRERMLEIASMVREALESTGISMRTGADSGAGAIDARGALLGLMEDYGKGAVIAVQELLARAEAMGIGGDEGRRVILELLEEGECYAPRNGFVKRL